MSCELNCLLWSKFYLLLMFLHLFFYFISSNVFIIPHVEFRRIGLIQESFFIWNNSVCDKVSTSVLTIKSKSEFWFDVPWEHLWFFLYFFCFAYFYLIFICEKIRFPLLIYYLNDLSCSTTKLKFFFLGKLIVFHFNILSVYM